jgi:hypothetical protein
MKYIRMMESLRGKKLTELYWVIQRRIFKKSIPLTMLVVFKGKEADFRAFVKASSVLT